MMIFRLSLVLLLLVAPCQAITSPVHVMQRKMLPNSACVVKRIQQMNFELDSP
jgi:hypothetical protein